jgi:hypothetical protein
VLADRRVRAKARAKAPKVRLRLMRVRVGPSTTMRGVAKWVEVETARSPFPKIPTLESASWKAGADAGCHERCHPEHFRKSAGRQTPRLATSRRDSGFADGGIGFRSQPGRS